MFLFFFVPFQAKGDATINGVVSDSVTSLPISGAFVAAIRGNTVRYTTFTDINGSYTLNNVKPSNYTLVYSASGYQTQAVGIKANNNQINTVNIELVPNGGTITGTVTNAISSLPISGALVFIFQESILITSQTTNGAGVYVVPNLAPGPYTVLVIASGFQGQAKSTTITAGMTTVVDFALQPNPGSITGQVIDAVTLNPIEDAQVAVFSNSILVGFANTDVNGNYTIDGLAPGTYTVLARADNYRGAFSSEMVTAGGTTVSNFALDPNPGSVTGLISSLCDGSPIPGAFVEISDGPVALGFVLSDINGIYTIDGLAPGTYTITASKQNFLSNSAPVTVIADAETVVNISLTPMALPPGSIGGRVIKNRFLTQAQLLHFIFWSPSPGSCVIGYEVFRNDVFVAFVSAIGPLEYIDHTQSSGNTYTVKSVNSFGEVSEGISITL